MQHQDPVLNQDSNNESSDNADVIGALVVLSVAILVAIHFIQTGGLPAFFSRLF